MWLFYSSPVADYVKASVDAVIGIHLEEDPGDILVFLTGQVRLLNNYSFPTNFSQSMIYHLGWSWKCCFYDNVSAKLSIIISYITSHTEPYIILHRFEKSS